VVLSAYEIVFQLFMACSDVIDGLAVAGQALVAKYLGAAQPGAATRLGRTLIVTGLLAGLSFAAVFVAGENWIIGFFTVNPDVILLITSGAFLLIAALQPLNGVVFVLDGLLIGARDTRFLMWAMLLGALGMFIPVSWMSLNSGWGLAGILMGLTGLMLWRCVTNAWRFGSKKWIVAGS